MEAAVIASMKPISVSHQSPFIAQVPPWQFQLSRMLMVPLVIQLGALFFRTSC